ncbi:hypothetical protein [Pseudomonas caricapapayae]|uniref:hypothetical protein n=1 Tax=Pseudomonas caricapapayae TaxID=46678 RepID=UPI0013520C21
MHQIAINAGHIGLRDQVKKPALRSAQAVRASSKINTQNGPDPPHQTDHSAKTNRNVLHHHPPVSDPKRQWSIFFN